MSEKSLYTGSTWNLLRPDADTIFMRDIVTALARINRYDGHSRVEVSVLWHSLLVEKIAVGRAKPYALLHDVHEAYLGDMTTPVKRAIAALLPAGQFNAAWGKLTHTHDEAIWQAFGIPVPSSEILSEVRRADVLALSTERAHFLPQSNCDWGELPEPLTERFLDNLPTLADGNSARLAFRRRARLLCPKTPHDIQPR